MCHFPQQAHPSPSNLTQLSGDMWRGLLWSGEGKGKLQLCARRISLGVMLAAPLSQPGGFSLLSFAHTQAQNLLAAGGACRDA